MRSGGSGVGERLGRNDDLRWQPGGVNRVERDRLLQAARREHAEACRKPTAKGSPPRWRRGIAVAGRRASQGERGGVHQCGVPPKGNADFAWVQHFIHHLAPQGMAGFILANGSKSSNQSGDCNARSARQRWVTDSQGLGSQRDIRQSLIEADLVDCMVALPGQLFYSTQIPVCLWLLAKSKAADAKRGFCERRQQTRRRNPRTRLARLLRRDVFPQKSNTKGCD